MGDRARSWHELSEREQTAADADQTGADLDQTLAESDQASSDRDQRASDRDQRLADRDRRAEVDGDVDRVPAGAAQRGWSQSTDDRARSTDARHEATEVVVGAGPSTVIHDQDIVTDESRLTADLGVLRVSPRPARSSTRAA